MTITKPRSFEGQPGASSSTGIQYSIPPAIAPPFETNMTDVEVLPPNWTPITTEVITIPAENVTIVSDEAASVATPYQPSTESDYLVATVPPKPSQS